MPSRTNAAGVVCVSACPVIGESPILPNRVGHASGGGSGSDITLPIKGHGSTVPSLRLHRHRLRIRWPQDPDHARCARAADDAARVEVFVINKLKLLGLHQHPHP